MNLPKYPLKAESSRCVFEFISEGSKGAIRKLILFQETFEMGVYNLAFGDRLADTQAIDDLAISNNGDSEKVLATVVAALYSFYEAYPEAFVYATGSTVARTRLYRISISRYYKEIIGDFELFGQIGDNFHPFEIGREYSGFLVQRRID